MKRWQGFIVVLALVVAQGCKEYNPGIRFTEPEKPLLDTSYTLTSPPSAQDKNVLLFDITGVRCNNCPEAAALARKIADTLHPGRVVVVALYPTSMPSLTSPWPGYDTMAGSDAEAIAGNLGSIPNLPIGTVDQIKSGGTYFLDRATWNGHVNNRIALATPLNIDLASKWLTADNKARVEIKVTYTKDLGSSKNLIFIGVMESEVVGKQSDKNAAGGIVEDYEHNHALRKLYTATTGDTLKATLSAGRVFEKHYYIQPRHNWKPDHLEIVVWVVDAATKEVLHSQRTYLKK